MKPVARRRESGVQNLAIGPPRALIMLRAVSSACRDAGAGPAEMTGAIGSENDQKNRVPFCAVCGICLSLTPICGLFLNLFLLTAVWSRALPFCVLKPSCRRTDTDVYIYIYIYIYIRIYEYTDIWIYGIPR